MHRFNFIVLGFALIATACSFGVSGSTGEIIVPSVATPDPANQEATGGASSGEGQPTELSLEQIQNISKATVQIFVAQEDLQPLRSGSGTVIAADGQIVTNCNIACGAPVLMILLTTSLDQPPQALYRAEVTAFDETLDLALLQINQDINGNPVDPATLNLPFLPRGDSSTLNPNDQVRIFGYAGVTGTAVSFTSGSVTGFQNSLVNGVDQRISISTDATIESGISGGATVDLFGRLVAVPTTINPSVREGITLGGFTTLLPINLIAELSRGTPPELSGSKLPPSIENDSHEPNDSLQDAAGPLATGETIQGFISWEDDLDVFFFDINTTAPVNITLTDLPSSVDYDLYVYSGSTVVAKSENESSTDESVEFSPSATGRLFVAVSSFEGTSADQAYSLNVNYDSGKSGAGAVNISGVVIDGTTGQPFVRGVFGILNDGVSCSDFFGGSSLDMSLVINTATTDANGAFLMSGVPTGPTYGAFFFFETNNVCQNSWLPIPDGGGDVDIGTITLSF